MAEVPGAGGSCSSQFNECSGRIKGDQFGKIRRNKYRRYRKRRSQTRYYSHLRKRRFERKSEELCEAVSFVNITDMDFTHVTQPEELRNTTQDVAEWHQFEQTAFWKSRALALEMENRVLHKHVKSIYEKLINHYENHVQQNVPNPKNDEEGNSPDKEKKVEKEMQNSEKETMQSKEKEVENSKKEDSSNFDEETLKPPNVYEAVLAKQNEMSRLYGKMAPKIAGMETAIQLNYDFQCTINNPCYWPNIPLRL